MPRTFTTLSNYAFLKEIVCIDTVLVAGITYRAFK